ncbi:MAG: hypothetical protein K9M07_03340 [Simkaniaceae bacterium]|nr:hypothetical protein [Simkaniaceae bacterium]MCF7852258.1 hypothetical protein [Simkaniaceae bacterium]
MKRLFVFLTLIAGLALHAEEKKEAVSKQSKPLPKVLKYDLTYFSLGTVGIENNKMWIIAPQLSFGKRVVYHESGVDFSAVAGYSLSKQKVISYALPKIMYIRYLEPVENNSTYYGIGGSWGGIHNLETHKHFHGILLNAAVGIEFNRKTRFPNMIQLDLAIPAISAFKEGSTPSPSLSLSYALGF